MMLFAPAGENLVREAIARAMNAQDIAARDAITARRALYGGQALEIINSKIDVLFADAEERKSLRRMAATSLNLVRYVIDTLAVVYRYGATRTWNNETPVEKDGITSSVNDDATAAYARAMDQCEANETLDYVNKMCLLCGDVVVRYEYGKWGHRLYPMTRDVCDVIQDEDDPRRIRGVIWSVQQTDTPIWQGNQGQILRRRWFHADAEKTTEYSADGRVVGSPVASPYKKLNEERPIPGQNSFFPFLDFHDSYRPYTFWREHTDEELYSLAIEACVWLTYLNGQLKFNTLKQVYETPSKEAALAGKLASQVMSWLAVYQGPAGGQVGILDYTVDLDMTIRVLKAKLELFCSMRGLPGSVFSVAQTQSASGISIKLDRVALSEMRGQRLNHYIARERVLARLVQYASNYGFVDYPKDEVIAAGLSPERLTVDFGEPPQAQDPKEDREQWQWEFEHGISTPAEFLTMKTSDMTRESAEAIIEANLSARAAKDAENMNARVFGTTPAVPATVDEDQQQQ